MKRKNAALFLRLKMSSHIEMLTKNVKVRGWEREASGMWKLEVVVRLSFCVSYFSNSLPSAKCMQMQYGWVKEHLKRRKLGDSGKKETREKKSSECCGIFYGLLINSQWRVLGECYNNLLCQPSAWHLTVGKSLCDSTSPHSLFKADLHAPHSNAGQPQNDHNMALLMILQANCEKDRRGNRRERGIRRKKLKT